MVPEGERGWCDSHCHLDYLVRGGEEASEVVASAREAGVDCMVTIGTRCDRLGELEALSHNFSGVYMSVGQHPCHVAEEGVVSVADLEVLCGGVKVVAVGETGLDYFRTREHKAIQEESFENHMVVARRTGLPLVIHSRSSGDDMLSKVKEGMEEGEMLAIWHCFDGSVAEAERALDMGMMLSFSGILTYKKREDLREIASWVAADRLLLETDSPYLSPEPYRGKTNRPSHVVHTGGVLAGCRGISEASLREILWENTHRIFWRMRGEGMG